MPRPERLKRRRALQACDICRVRKNRCSEDRPCTYCVDHDLTCVYPRDRGDKKIRFSEPAITVDNASTQEHRITSPVAVTEQTQHQDTSSVQPELSENILTTPAVDMERQSTACDVMDTNSHTRSFEFYGGASSVSFLRRVESTFNSQSIDLAATSPQPSLASRLYNTEFKPGSTRSTSRSNPLSREYTDRFYFRVAQRFLDAYFSSIHQVEPLFDESAFLSRCENLWFGHAEKESLSFVALYHATLSLGSLVICCEDWGKFGADRFFWSRKLLDEALSIVNQLGSATDLEIAQCHYMISKVCQHELNLHVAYLHSGRAARIALAIGLNRRPFDPGTTDLRTSIAAPKTWWTIYCQDIQISFALGRPDSLGFDEYHTQCLPVTQVPNVDNSLHTSRTLQIVPSTVQLSRIMRKTAMHLYTSPQPIDNKVSRVKALELELEHWRTSLPTHLQPVDPPSAKHSLKNQTHGSYSDKQTVVLNLHYWSLRMIIHGVFASRHETIPPDWETKVQEYRAICLQSACQSIELIHKTFMNYNFFQTWWYNTTYVLFAVSVILTAIFHKCIRTRRVLDDAFDHIDRAIAVLQVLDECVVARKAMAIIQRALSRSKSVSQPQLEVMYTPHGTQESLGRPPTMDSNHSGQNVEPGYVSTELDVGPTMYDDGSESFAWPDPTTDPFGDYQQALFWTTWAQELNDLGTQVDL